MIGFIINYKYYEGPESFGHYYEILCQEDGDKYYYAHGEQGKEVNLETKVEIDLIIHTVTIAGFTFQLLGPFEKVLTTVNYKGFVVDCLDSDIGVYNLDNEIFLFGSACLDLQIGNCVTLLNLHSLRINDSNWIFKLFGSSLKKSLHILVYCPAYSSYIEGIENITYDNIIRTRSNFSSLIYSYKWLKNSFQLEFPGFQSFDELGSILFPDCIGKGAKFIGHCAECSFTENFYENFDALKPKNLLSPKNIKETFVKVKDSLLSTNAYDNHTRNRTSWLRNEVIYGKITRRTSVLFDVTSDGKSITIYCNDSNFSPPQDTFIFIFNSLQIVELVPKLRIPNTWSVKAYVWISPESSVWSPTGYFWSDNYSKEMHENQQILCKIVRKYLIQKDIDFLQYEMSVIHVESEKGTHCFNLNPNEKFYGILPSDQNEEILVIRHFISEYYFKEPFKDPLMLSSSGIFPTVKCTLNVDANQGPLQVRINDLPYLSQVKGLQFFSLKLRFYSIFNILIKLTCLKCKNLIEEGICSRHLDTFEPNLVLSAVFETADMNGSTCNIFIDQFSHFEKILGTLKTNFKEKLISFLRKLGALKLSSEHFLFSSRLKQTEEAFDFPSVSKVINCTFPVTAASSVLKPIDLDVCDPKVELTRILKLF